MLINFTVGNYRSFKEKKTLSLEATSIKEHSERVIVCDKMKFLPVVAIYGANSSGKSNLLYAINFFCKCVIKSLKTVSTDRFDIEPFLLNNETKKEPAFFEVEFLIESSIYRYGFSLDKEKVVEEWLYMKTDGKGREKKLFYRESDIINFTSYYPEGKGLDTKTRHNALFLSVVDSFNGEISKKIVKAVNSLLPLSGIDHSPLSNISTLLCQNSHIWEGITFLLKEMDVGINRLDIPENEDVAKEVKAYTYHNVYDDHGAIIGEEKFTMAEHESDGTNKLFDLLSAVLLALDNGLTIIIDELDSKLHPLISRYLINMFNDLEINRNNATLIFTTHDTNLLNSKILRGDQIWFTEKDKTEATDLYSLVEFTFPDGTKIRNDRSYEKDYIQGRYGAIPYIKD